MPIEIAYTPSLEPGTYDAVITNVEVRINKEQQPYRWWEFTTEEGRTISAISSMNVGPKSKAGQWIAALLGRQPVMGESVEIIGLPCIIGVSVNPDGFSQIDTVLGRKKKAAPGASTPVIEAVRASEAPTEEPEPSPNDPLPF